MIKPTRFVLRKQLFKRNRKLLKNVPLLLNSQRQKNALFLNKSRKPRRKNVPFQQKLNRKRRKNALFQLNKILKPKKSALFLEKQNPITKKNVLFLAKQNQIVRRNALLLRPKQRKNVLFRKTLKVSPKKQKKSLKEVVPSMMMRRKK